MDSSRLRLGIVGAVGLLAPLWWTVAASYLSLGIFVLIGSPERPNRFVAWSTIVLPCVVLGFGIGAIISAICRFNPLRGWAMFLISAAIGTLVSLVLAGGMESFGELMRSPGTWAFVVSSVVAPFVHRRIKGRM
jgi:hypothetical protein